MVIGDTNRNMVGMYGYLLFPRSGDLICTGDGHGTPPDGRGFPMNRGDGLPIIKEDGDTALLLDGFGFQDLFLDWAGFPGIHGMIM